MRTLYRNGHIYRAGAASVSSMLVADAAVVWMGDDNVASGGLRRSDEATVVDLHGGLVTPAFVDAHVHATSTGLALSGLDLSRCATLPGALDAVERAARASGGRPILGGGWDETHWPEKRPPTAAELDRAAYGGSVYLARVDVHSAVVSSVLAAAVPGLAGLSGYRSDGWLSRDAHDAARTAAHTTLRPAQIRAAQRAALRQAASLGIGCVHEMAGPSISSADDLAGLLALAGEEPLPDVVGYWGELFGIETARELGAVGAGGDLFCDGSLGSHTAALSRPYADRPDTQGALRFTTADLAEHIARCTAAGLQAGFHAIGDAAVDQVLDAVDLVTARLGGPGGTGHRIEHAEMVRDPERLAASGLVASVQPAFDSTWGGPRGMYAERLGADRARGLNRFAQLAGAGVPLAFGSDAPVTSLGPWAAVRAAAHPTWSDAALTAEAARAAHTRGGGRAAGRAADGVLVPGGQATFAVWQATRAPTGLPDLAPGRELPCCVRTVVRGETIFDADRPSG
ncbi:MAG: amidohydrolase family protein [Pseudonocardiales bacterium]